MNSIKHNKLKMIKYTLTLINAIELIKEVERSRKRK